MHCAKHVIEYRAEAECPCCTLEAEVERLNSGFFAAMAALASWDRVTHKHFPGMQSPCPVCDAIGEIEKRFGRPRPSETEHAIRERNGFANTPEGQVCRRDTIEARLVEQAGGNYDGEPWATIQEAADVIVSLRRRLVGYENHLSERPEAAGCPHCRRDPVEIRLVEQAAGENCDGEPWDTMQEAADVIVSLRRRIACYENQSPGSNCTPGNEPIAPM